MIVPFLPIFGWFFLYHIMLYVLDEPIFLNEQKINKYVLFTSLVMHLGLVFSAICVIGG